MSTPSTFKEEVQKFKRRRIREEACKLFYEHGYESTTIDAIAQRLEVTKPFVYSYYESKGEILFDICRTGIELSLEALRETSSESRTPSERLRLLVGRVLRVIIDYQEYIVIYEREEKNLDPGKAREIRKQRSQFDHELAQLLREGNEAGEFQVPDPMMTAITIGGMVTWVSSWYSPTGKRTELEVITHVMQTVEAVVRNSVKRPADGAAPFDS